MKRRYASLRVAKLVRIAIGGGLAIVIAEALSLQYSASAGIIALLTIQNTKKETIEISMKRILSFVLSLMIAYPLFQMLGYHAYVFGLFLLLFVGMSELFHLQDGISMNAVLTTHFLIEQTMKPTFIANEFLILAIGMGVGVGMNMMIRKHTKEVRTSLILLDEMMQDTLRFLARSLVEENQISIDFAQQKHQINDAMQIANEHVNNHLLADMAYFVQYCSMRINQLSILEAIDQVIREISQRPVQAKPIADYLLQIADSYDEQNQITDLFVRYDEVMQYYQHSQLPSSRNEFEHRARLFQILVMIRQFLLLKRQFVEGLSEKQKEQFWHR